VRSALDMGKYNTLQYNTVSAGFHLYTAYSSNFVILLGNAFAN